MTNIKTFQLPAIKLSEALSGEELSQEIQLLKTGDFYHDGEILKITPDTLTALEKNFSEGVRGIDLMLDYKHESEDVAAAWFNKVRLSADGKQLFATVDWTPRGRQVVKDREYRYVSAEFHPNYMNNETGKKHGPTLLGAALTNRPVIKGMKPTILSEQPNQSKDIQMKTVEELTAENATLVAQLAAQKLELDAAAKISTDAVALSEKTKADLKLVEEKTAADKVLAEKKSKFDVKLSEGKVCEAQREDFMSGNMEGFLEKAVQVKLSTDGHNGNGNGGGESTDSKTPAQDKIKKLSEARATEKKISLGEAMKQVMREDKALADGYALETKKL
jgi:hypothetical protein